MPGRSYLDLADIANEQYGYITPADAGRIGIPSIRLAEMGERGALVRVAHGLYRLPTVPVTMLDQLMEATLWPRGQGILSHSTALDLLDLCDVSPAKVHITVPRGFRLRRAAVPAVYLFHRRDLTPDVVMRHEGIPIVTPYRAILDGIEIQLGSNLIDQAIESAERRGLLTPDQMAEVLRRR